MPERYDKIEYVLALGDEPLAQIVAKIEGKLEGLTAHARPLRVFSSEELLTMKLPPRELILSPILRSKDLAMIHSWRGTGKTWVGLGISAAVAAGGKFLRWEVARPHGVLYVDGEMPAEAIQERLALVIQSCDLEPNRLKIITPDLLEHGVPNLATPEGQAQLEQQLEDIELLVLDHLSALFRGLGSENDSESAEVAQEFMLRLRRKGVSCVLMHHSGKQGLQRGTSKREDVLDLVVSLRHAKNYSPTEGARFEVHFEKARGAFGKDVDPFEARLENDPNGKSVWTVRDLEKQTYAEAVRLAKEGLTGREITDELGKNKSTISRHLKKAREKGDLS